MLTHDGLFSAVWCLLSSVQCQIAVLSFGVSLNYYGDVLYPFWSCHLNRFGQTSIEH